MPPIYADSIGGIGSLLQADSNRRAAQSQQVFANLMAQRQQDESMQRFGQELAQRQGEQAQTLALHNAQLEASKAERAATLDYQNRALKMSGEYQNWLMKQPNKLDSTDQERRYKDAISLAVSGIDVPTDGLSDSQKANVEAAKKLSTDEHNQLATSSVLAADTLNKHARALKFKTGLESDIKDASQQEDAHLFDPRTWGRMFVKDSPAYNDATTTLKAVTGALPELGSKASKILSDKGLSGLVRYNPNTDAYEPVIQPRQLRMNMPPTAGTGTNAVPTMAAPQVVPRALNIAPPVAPPPMMGTNRPAMPPVVRQNGILFRLMPNGQYEAVP